MSETVEPFSPASHLWVCIICGWIYDEASGVPEDGIPPGTPWNNVPDSWVCPLCDAKKNEFEMVRI
ncbi:Anaerobic nitric oxide reductase flavorubredoxin [Paraburkholderia ultramafica]|uniref:Rubredoxin n=1 Tax=Paraburkholderia ultramafica TaxID=1544867 RepID=A0A6S7B8A6_9BURK|nr:rubredoxin [Paraburkholderia ultramafica]CAB3791213.1 Anaerobic nitric oxide reductase flavorubredoxin [Paraburkholderia ultramafica]